MNICMISYWSCPLTPTGVLTAGGMNIYVINLVNNLGKLGHNVDVYTRVHSQKDEKILTGNKNVRIIHLDSGKLGNYKQFALKVEKFIKKEDINYDIIHAHYYFSGLVAIQIKNKLKIPLITTFHSLEIAKEVYVGKKNKSRKKNERKVVEKSDGIIASTELEKVDLIKTYGAYNHKIFIVSPGVNHHLFFPRNKIFSRLKLKLPLKKKIILFVGRIDPIKGLSVLIEAIGKLTRLYPSFSKKFRVLLIGGDIENRKFWENSEVKKIRRLIKEKELECCIHFIGSKPHSKLPYYYSAADITVLPSLYESFGLVILEAMACGCAVIASKTGGMKYIIRDGESGRFFRNNDMEELSLVLWELLHDKKYLLELGKNAVGESLNYCWDKQSQKVVKVYKKFGSN